MNKQYVCDMVDYEIIMIICTVIVNPFLFLFDYYFKILYFIIDC